MLRLFFLAVTAVLLVSVGYILLPRNAARPDAHLDTPPPATAPADPTTFTVHDAAPAPPMAPPPPPTPQPSQSASSSLDAVMQRLRAAAAQHPDPPAPESPPAPAAVIPPPQPTVIRPTPATAALAGPRWTTVTPQGARWRMTPAPDGFIIDIDIGGNRVASVHVAPAFANLDQAAMNQRVDFLKQTILQNFPPETASYTFARDGSVALDH